jgi:tetratricopeptide (TPR) repeat protein/TolB-like protein
VTNATDSLKNDLADRFTVEREIGRGGMATVYLARDLRHDRLVALKVLHPEISHSLGAERFLREIAIAGRLSHPHILPLYDSGEVNGSLFFVMPYIEGESLREHLTREIQLPVPEAIRITAEVADALEYAHGEGIVHRDIKPENILISGAHAIVADFGIARAITQARGGSLTETGMALGSPMYMSPEQASGESRLDGRTDVYSLGCVLYEMLAGEAPFTGPTTPIIIAKRFAGPPTGIRKIRPTIPIQIEAATEKALAMSPADRFSTAGEFARALTSSEFEAPRRSRYALPVASQRTNRLLLAALAFLVLIGAGTTIRSAIGKRTSASVGKSGAALDVNRIAVAVFANHAGDRALDPIGTMAADWITNGLMQSGASDVVDVGAVYSQGRDTLGVPTDPLTFARNTGAGTVISGSYDLAGDSVVFKAAVIDVTNGRVIRTLEPVKSFKGEPERGIELLRKQALTALAARTSAESGLAPASHLPSYAAFQAFVAGQTVFWQENQNSEQAEVDFRRAAALDSTFWWAAIWVGFSSASNGHCETTDSVGHALAPHLGELTLVERLSLQNVVSSCHGERNAIYLRAVERAQAEPGSAYFKFLLGIQAAGASRPRAALQALLSLDPQRDLVWMSPRARIYYWGNLTGAYHQLGEHEKELEAAREFLRQSPNRPSGIRLEVVALAALGRADDALDQLEQLGKMPPNKFSTAISFYDAAIELMVHSDGQGAYQEIAEREVVWYRSQPKDEQGDPAEVRATARCLELLHRYDEAKLLVDLLRSDTMLFSSDSVEVIGDQAVLAAWRGDRTEAARKDHELAMIKGPYLNGQPTFFRAQTAAILGDSVAAMTLLRSAIANGMSPLEAHADPAFTSLRHSSAFQDLLRPQG